MKPFRPPGTLLLVEALGRAMQVWSADAWDRLRPEAREFFKGEAPLHGFHLAALSGQAAVQEDYGRLRMLLAEGVLPSRARVPQGPPVPIAAGAWQAGAADRLADVLAGRVRLAGPDSAGDVLILADDLDAVLAGRQVSMPVQAEVSVAADDRPSTKRRGGRPPKAGVDDFWIEAARLVYTGQAGAAGQTQQSFIDTMLTWSRERQGADAYGEDAVDDKIKKLWKVLKLGRSGG